MCIAIYNEVVPIIILFKPRRAYSRLKKTLYEYALQTISMHLISFKENQITNESKVLERNHNLFLYRTTIHLHPLPITRQRRLYVY